MIATFYAYAVASVVSCLLILHPSNGKKIRRLGRSSVVFFIIAGALTSIAQILRFYTLYFIAVSVATPLFTTNSLFIFPLSYFFNRRLESFNLKIITGAITVIAGVSLLFWAA